MRFVVTQIGARRGYAVPVILEQAGVLERFYTDLAGNVGWGKWLVRLGPLLGLKSAAARLAGRRVPESIKAKTVTLDGPTFWFACNRRLCPADAAARFREQLRWSRSLGWAIGRRGFGAATHVYSLLGECGPVPGAAKQAGLTIVTEVYISLSTERILAQEQRTYPEWEPVPADLDSVRREFPDEAQLLTQTDIAVCPSEVVRRDLEENFGFSSERGVVVPYGVDSRWLTLPSYPVAGRVLFVGTAGLRKGIHYVGMAAEQLRAKGRRYDFRVAGEVARRVADQPACRDLTFLGRVRRDRIQAEYASADVFVLPSLAEGSAEATYEALAMGLPVITTAAAGSVVRHEIEGYIVPERDPAALARAIEQVVENRQSRATLALAARERARDFTLDRYRERLVSAVQGFKP